MAGMEITGYPTVRNKEKWSRISKTFTMDSQWLSEGKGRICLDFGSPNIWAISKTFSSRGQVEKSSDMSIYLALVGRTGLKIL